MGTFRRDCDIKPKTEKDGNVCRNWCIYLYEFMGNRILAPKGSSIATLGILVDLSFNSLSPLKVRCLVMTLIQDNSEQQ